MVETTITIILQALNKTNPTKPNIIKQNLSSATYFTEQTKITNPNLKTILIAKQNPSNYIYIS